MFDAQINSATRVDFWADYPCVGLISARSTSAWAMWVWIRVMREPEEQIPALTIPKPDLRSKCLERMIS